MTSSGPRRIPAATYRLQLHRDFTFRDAAALAGYLHDLGVTDAYLSPVFRARPGSRHGYDVVDHASLNPELDGEEGFAALATAVQDRGLGLVLDLVPNHMCVTSPENTWWTDVLENGPSSPFARYFDVDWLPPKADLVDKVLLPLLGEQYGRVLENQELRVGFAQGAFHLEYYEHRLPMAPRAWPVVLGPVLDRLKAERGESDAAVLELESILTAIAHLPLRSETAPDRVRERQREKEIIKRRLAAVASAPTAEAALDAALADLNGRRGEPRSFDRLEAMLAEQAYRLSFWRVASDEINYRRFFDINELAALRVEEAEVFEALHALPLRLASEGAVQGLRIDHVDGLFDPSDYLARLPEGAYVVVEKILIGEERLREDWPVQGTTGYDFLNLLSGLLADPGGRRELDAVYGRFTGLREHASDVAYECRKLVLDVSMSSEITVLARRLDRISEHHRFSRDFTLNSLQAALGEVIACFPVYRTYLRAETGKVAPEDRRYIEAAVRLAKRRNPATSESLFDFVASVLLLADPDGLDEAQRRERRDFVMRFQQLTGPVMAKGLEDTASYRLHPLASLNEVGSELGAPAVSLERFHRENAARLRTWPHTMNATSTHDTKRDEDVRARIHVLSEVAHDFEDALRRWREIARPHRTTVDDVDAPGPNAEYLLYQTLVGTWPTGLAGGEPSPEYVERIQAYMRKALREAKVHTSWVSPNEPYERAVDRFVAGILDASAGKDFVRDFSAFVRPIVRPGLLAAVSQVLLKITSPGVPDFYQGTETWEFNLVDPDNRRPVDFERRRRQLADLDAPGASPGAAGELLERIEDGRLKLFVTSRSLRFRRRRHALFREGDYHPLTVEGEGRARVIAFARSLGAESALAVAGRFFAGLPARPLGEPAWRETAVTLGPVSATTFRDVFTGQEVQVRTGPHGPELPVAEVFARLPFALLERMP
ncbi:MAG TPA: malto-oligosyltrehalose synthase [Vicinamibacteria bacterium]|nr:malto-oligosyltrehalose synthase [Vicinamibacteria bacterium]